MNPEIKIFTSKDWEDYELLDTGEGEKLEQVGSYKFIRPYQDALWSKTLKNEWKEIDGKFTTSKEEKVGWGLSKVVLDKWEMEYKGIKFYAKPTSFRHFGFFPEQAVHWDFIEKSIKNSGRPIKFLNLFGYTAVASLFALRAGAEVTHLDASKQSIDWAKENQKLNSELVERPMRIILDDAIKFLEREQKRGVRYDAVIMDPPKFGRGPKGEVWKIEEGLAKLLGQIRKVLSDQPLFIILNSYATDTSSLALGYSLREALQGFSGKVEAGELCLIEKSHNRFISLSNTAVWHNSTLLL